MLEIGKLNLEIFIKPEIKTNKETDLESTGVHRGLGTKDRERSRKN